MHRSLPRLAPLAALAALATLAAPLSAQATWTVDDDGPADFTDVQAAVNIAADGDTILVKAGVYGTLAIHGKGLTIQADGDAQLAALLLFQPGYTLRIENLAADQAVHLRGFGVTVLAGAEQTLARISACDGPVLIEDCELAGAGTALEVASSASVTISRSRLIAAPTFASYDIFGGFFGFASYLGLAAQDSNVFLYDSELYGSDGGNSGVDFTTTIPPGPTQPAMRLAGGTLLASGSTFVGGSGGSDLAGLCFAGEDGSPGLELAAGFAGAPTARLIDCVTTGGTGGTGGCGLPDGADAPGTLVGAGDLHLLPGAARSFTGGSPAVGGTAVQITLTGEPGDTAILHASAAAAPGLFLAGYDLALHLALPLGVLPLGTIPPSGTLDVALPLPGLPPGVDSFRFVGQTLFLDGVGFFDGGPSTLLVTMPGL